MPMKCWLAAFFGLQFINPILLHSHTAVLSIKYTYLHTVCTYISYIIYFDILYVYFGVDKRTHDKRIL